MFFWVSRFVFSNADRVTLWTLPIMIFVVVVVVNAHQCALWVQLSVANFLYRELFALSWGQLSVLLAPKAPSLCKSSASSLSNSVNFRIWVQSIESLLPQTLVRFLFLGLCLHYLVKFNVILSIYPSVYHPEYPPLSTTPQRQYLISPSCFQYKFCCVALARISFSPSVSSE